MKFYLSLLIIANLFAQNLRWQHVGPPGLITGLEVYGDSILAGTSVGDFFVSENNGKNWYLSSQGLQAGEEEYSARIRHIVACPNSPSVIYLGTGTLYSWGGKGIYKSSDGGKSWEEINHGLLGSPVIHSIAVHPKNKNIVFITVEDYKGGKWLHHLYKSVDGGENWSSILNLNEQGYVLFADSNSLFVFEAQSSVLKSNDLGKTWQHYYGEKSLHRITRVVYDISQKVFYLSDFRNGVFKIEFGKSFQEIPITLSSGSVQFNDLAFDPESNRLFVAVNNAGIFQTKDFVTWEKIFDLPSSVMKLKFKNKFLYVATSNGIYQWKDQTWYDVSRSMGSAHVNYISVSKTHPNIIYCATPYGLYKSENYGQDWTYLWQIGGGEYVDQVLVSPGNPNIIYAVFGGYNSKFWGVFKSNDAGKTWKDISPMANTPYTALAINKDSLTHIFAGSPDAVWKSTTDGEEWDLSLLRSGGSETRVIKISESNPNFIYVGVTSNVYFRAGIWISEDYGKSWHYRVNGFPESIAYRNIISLAIDPFNPQIIYAGNTDVGIFKSVDLGHSWYRLENGLPELAPYDARVCAININPNDGKVIYAAIGDGNLNKNQRGLYRSLDEGQSWKLISTISEQNNQINCMDYYQNKQNEEIFYIGTRGAGIFTNCQFNTQIKSKTLQLPVTLKLFQNHPNPFNNTSIIRFYLSKRSTIKLTIYNLLGQSIKTLYDGNCPAGNHLIRLDATNLSSGIYFYTLVTNDASLTKKFIVLK